MTHNMFLSVFLVFICFSCFYLFFKITHIDTGHPHEILLNHFFLAKRFIVYFLFSEAQSLYV